MKSALKVSLLASLVISATAQAEEGFRQHDAHVHGHVEFNIAQDGNELLLEITAPGSDVVGFEHAPENEQQHELIEKAEETLKQADKIILLSSAAGCQTEFVGVANTLESEEEHAGHDHDEHDHDEHHKDDKHDHDSHDEHKEHHDDHDDHDHEGHDHDKHHDDHEEKGGHGEFTIEYHFECKDIAALKTIETTWFSSFANTEEISVNLLTDAAAKSLELTKDNPVIKL